MLDLRALKVIGERQEREATLALRDLQDRQVLKGSREILAWLAQRAPRDPPEPLALKV